jgi:hypothetical protein
MTLRLADDTPGREQMVTALCSPTLGIRTPPEEVEISETNVATKIKANKGCAENGSGYTVGRCHYRHRA